MAMGRRDAGRQQDLFVTTDQLPKSIGHVFYGKLNELLAEAGFDAWVEQLCEKHYAERKGRPGVPPESTFECFSSVTSRVFSRNVESLGDAPTACHCVASWEFL